MFWPFEKRASGRYPEEPAQAATTSSSSFTDATVDAMVARAAGSAVDPHSLAAAETCVALWERCLSSAVVEPMNSRLTGVTPELLALIGRGLATRGEMVAAIEVEGAQVRLVPVGSYDVRGPWDEAEWWYRADLFGPNGNITKFLPSSAVLHFRIGADPWRRWRGIGPLHRSASTAALGAAVEASLIKESKIPTGRLALAHGAGKVDGVLNWLRIGGHAVAGDTAARGLQTEPAQRHKPQYYGPEPEAVMQGLRTDVGRDILAAFGVSPVLFSERGDGTGQREAWRRFVFSTVAPLARMIESEMRLKLDATAVVSISELRAADEDGRSRATMRRVQAAKVLMVDMGMARDEALRRAGLEV